MIGSYPHKKSGRDESRDQQGGGVSSNRRTAENVGPLLRMRDQATDPTDAIVANQIDDKFDFACAFKKQSDNQYDRQRDEGMEVKQRHRSVN